MATLTGIGPRLDLTGPRPVAPPNSLLNTPGVVVEDGEGRWMNGVVLDTYPAGTPITWDPCSAGTFRTKDSQGDARELPTFDSFVVYVPTICSYFSSNGLQEMTSVALDARQSFGVEYGLAHGVVDNPYFADAGLTQLGANGITAAEALARLENAIGATGQMGMIHATPAVVSVWMTDKLEGDEQGNLLTSNGTPVVSGGGYIGVHPFNKTASSDGSDWVFATGPVEVRLGPTAISDVRSSLDRDDNTIEFRAERAVLAEWSTDLQVGCLVKWSA
jgi:hypothetical protein